MTTVDDPWDAEERAASWSAASLDGAVDPVTQWQPQRDALGEVVDFVLLSANRAGRRVLHRARFERGSAMSDLVPPDEWPGLRNTLARAFDHREHAAQQVRITNRYDASRVAHLQLVTIPIGPTLVVWTRDIDTDARHAEVLAKTVHALGSATRLTNVGSFYIDLRTGALTCSPEYLRLIGVGADEPPPTVADLIEMTHPDDRQQADHIAAILRTGQSTRERFTARLRTRDGRDRLLVGTMSYEFNDDGHPVRAHGAVQDMTEIVAIEAQAREHHDFLEAILHGAPNAIFVKDAIGRFVLTNHTFAALFERTPAELIGLTDAEVFPAGDPRQADIATWRQEDLRVVTGLEEIVMDAHFVDLGGRAHQLRVRKSPLVLADGTVHLLGVLTDITDESVARDQLRASEARFRAALFGSPVATAVIDWGAGRFTAVNRAYEEFLGYAAEEIVAQPAQEFLERITFPGDDTFVAQIYDAVSDGWTAERRVERRYRHRDGTERWGILSTSVVPDAHGRPEQVISQVVDVTEQHEADARLRQSEALIRALVAHSTDVVTVLGPDLRVRYVSPAVEHVLGYAPDDYPDEGVRALVHPDDAERWSEHLAAARGEPDQVHVIEVRVRHANTDWIWIEGTIFNLLDDPDVQGLVNHFRDVTERHVAEETLAHRALHDALTGLPNRLLLVDRLQHALTRTRSNDRVAVAFLDLDHFKVVNDSLGHAAGDELLVAVADRLRAMVRPSDTVARLGGDEFVVCCEDIGDDHDALDVVERILVGLREPFRLGGRDARLTVSIGVALGDPGASPETLLRDADAAMYVAKGNGRDRYDVFNADVRSRVMWRLEVEHDLHHALDNDELTLLYQPIIELSSGRITGAEALIRWHHPTRGLLEPLRFIPIAEETGRIDQLGEWVLDRAAAQLAEWRSRGHEAIATLWVNLSARQLARPDLATRLERIVREHGIDPASIGLEITESVLMAERDASGTTVAELEAVGFRLAIDDFGTGYSSLSYLQRLHLDVLKIDRSFVAGLTDNQGDHSIVTAVIGLAHRLGISVSAEGVESPAQLAELRALGCDTACGFLIAEPAPPDDLEALLRQHPTW